MTDATTIAFAPLVAWPWLAGLALAGGLGFAYAFWRRAPATVWRLLAFAAGLLALANPALVEEERRALDDVAVIVVDASGSQRIGEREARTEAAVAEIETRLRGTRNLETRTVTIGRDDGPLGGGSQILKAMERTLGDVPPSRVAGLVIVTDGQVHDRAEDLARFQPGGPVHVLLSGERNERDRRLVVEQAPLYGIVDEQLELTLRIEDQGASPGGHATVRISIDDQRAVALQLPVGRSSTVPFRLDHGGPTVIEIETEAGADELTARNNRAVVVVNGVRDRLRVLLVSGEPHAGERAWRNILKSDPSVDLVHFTILRPPEKQDGTPIRELSLISFPTRELFQTKLDEFDLIIFDRYRRRGVLPDIYLRNVVDYVQKGGAVLVAAGPAFATPLSLQRTPLKQVLPSRPTGGVFQEGFLPRLSGLGRRHPVTADLPGSTDETPAWGRWFRMVDAELTSGNVLMQGIAERPVLILDRVGEGRVAQLLSDHVWLWARGFEGGGPQAELLRRVAHWLMKEPDLEEEDLRAHAEKSRLVVRRRSLGEAAAEVEVLTPSGERERLQLEADADGLGRATMAVDEPGLYRLSDGTLQAVAAVGELNPKEYADLRTTEARLAALVERTGGGIFWLAERLPSPRRVKPGRDAAGNGWLGLVANGDYVVTGIERIALLPALLVLALVLGVSMLAWYREGH
ncbi:MAG: hypothetical protein QF893_06200 [Alphaproteobacteria bacterium]|jgi:hypothetical protein|nr:hypothetical protein [Alphaproteobacteria bacterium]